MSVGVLFFRVLVDLFCFLLFYQMWVSHSHVDLEPTISSCFSLPKVEITGVGFGARLICVDCLVESKQRV